MTSPAWVAGADAVPSVITGVERPPFTTDRERMYGRAATPPGMSPQRPLYVWNPALAEGWSFVAWSGVPLEIAPAATVTTAPTHRSETVVTAGRGWEDVAVASEADVRRIYTSEGTLPDPASVAQLERCMAHPSAIAGALMADHHKGYSMPIGGVVAYTDQLSPSGVGFDIGCGNAAALTDLVEADVRPELARIMGEIESRIEFGVGGRSDDPRAAEDPVLEDARWEQVPGWVRRLRDKARAQLGTVGGGNHYVNLMADEEGRVWVCNHFGSRGLGHTIATGYLNLAQGRPPDARYQDDMDAPPVLIPADSELGAEYDLCRGLAASYALAGRLHVASRVLEILGAGVEPPLVNVHHNDYWPEVVNGEHAYVVRKGATPLRRGDRAYIGGSMTDGAAIVEGVSDDPATVYSAPHGAGRVMSRGQARGNRKGIRPGLVTRAMMDDAVTAAGIELRGGDLDESPFVYRPLDPVLAAHPNVRVVHRLRPLGVAMAPARTFDPYKD